MGRIICCVRCGRDTKAYSGYCNECTGHPRKGKGRKQRSPFVNEFMDYLEANVDDVNIKNRNHLSHGIYEV